MPPEDNPADDDPHAQCAAEIHRLEEERDALLDALRGLVAVVGLTAFKHEGQRAVLQEAVDNATAAIAKATEGGAV